MQTSDLMILHERVLQDDNTLARMYAKACEELKKRKKIFDKVRSAFDENDYVTLVKTKLAYEFAKEQFELLQEEKAIRGLI